MNIVQENIDELNAVLKVKVVSEDYQPKVETALKSYQKKANIPGFRPGKVPVNLIKKMYGKSVLIDSINQVLQDSVMNYLKDNDVDLLGQPLPKADGSDIDWDNQHEFEFSYEMGLAPKFEVEISGKDKVVAEIVKIDDEMVNNYINDIAKRYGKVENVEVSEKDDLLNGDFVELNEDGEIKEGGIFKEGASLFPARIKDEAAQKNFIGLKKEEKVVIGAQQISDNAVDLSATLGIEKEAAEQLQSKFQFTVKNITRLMPAEVNQEFYDKIYGEGTVKSEEEFKEKVREDLSKMYAQESDKKLYNNIVDYLMEKVNFDLPAEFLKRWILASNEKPITPEQLEKEFDTYLKGIKWQLIENKLIKQHDIKADSEELLNFTVDMIKAQMGAYGPMAIGEEELKQTAQRVLGNQQEGQKIYNQLLGQKMMDLFKTTLTLENKEVSLKDFFNQD